MQSGVTNIKFAFYLQSFCSYECCRILRQMAKKRGPTWYRCGVWYSVDWQWLENGTKPV